MSDNGKNSYIDKLKRLFHKKSTDIQQLKGNKNQSSKEGNLVGKNPDEKKSVKGQDLPEKKKNQLSNLIFQVNAYSIESHPKVSTFQKKKKFNPQPKGGSGSLRNQSEAENKPTKGQEPHGSPRQEEKKRNQLSHLIFQVKSWGIKIHPKVKTCQKMKTQELIQIA